MVLHYTEVATDDIARPQVLPSQGRPETIPRFGLTVRVAGPALVGDQQLLRKKLKEAAGEFLEAQPGVTFVLKSPGVRGDIPNVEALYVQLAGSAWMQQDDGQCLVAGLCNALDIVLGREATIPFQNYVQEAGVVVEKVSAIPAIFMAVQVPVKARKLRSRMREIFATKGFKVLDAVRKKVFVVFLDGSSTRCVFVDGFCRDTVHSVDPYPLRLSVVTLN